MSEIKILPILLLYLLLGMFSAHRFYVGKYRTAILQIVTLGGLGVWWLVDFLKIILGLFSDSHGNKISQWT